MAYKTLNIFKKNLWIGRNSRTAGNGKLENIDSLKNLKHIGGNISVTKNSKLQNVKGLIGLTTINADLTIIVNNNMQSFEGLENIREIKGDVYLTGNSNKQNNIVHLNSLKNLEKIHGLLSISSLINLTDLNGMQKLTYIGKGINLAGQTPQLKDISIFKNLINMPSKFNITINSNPSLTNLTGLENFKELNTLSISGISTSNIDVFKNLKRLFDLRIEHSEITNINGLKNVDSVSNFIAIRYNKNLSQCAIKSVCHRLYIKPYKYLIYGNSEGCNKYSYLDSVGDIYLSCQKVSLNKIKQNSIKVYPNPIKSNININIKNSINLDYLLFNSNGQIIKKGKVNNADQINLSFLANGVYYLSFKTNQQNIIKRVVKI